MATCADNNDMIVRPGVGIFSPENILFASFTRGRAKFIITAINCVFFTFGCNGFRLPPALNSTANIEIIWVEKGFCVGHVSVMRESFQSISMQTKIF